METSDVGRAIAAATAIARSAGLPVDDVVVLHRSNKLALRLLPADVMARVALAGQEVAGLELELASRLVKVGAPVVAPEPRVEPLVRVLDGFAITWWTYLSSVTPPVAPAGFADALARLHVGMRLLDVPVPRFTARVADALAVVTDPQRSPALGDDDRDLLVGRLGALRVAIVDDAAAEQLIHGEPHPGNLLTTAAGPLFIDLETCCRGPVELDLAHVPAAVAAHYPGLDDALLQDCRELVLAMVAAWRWDAGDRFPDGRRFGVALLNTLRAGPPWPTLDQVIPHPPASS